MGRQRRRKVGDWETLNCDEGERRENENANANANGCYIWFEGDHRFELIVSSPFLPLFFTQFNGMFSPKGSFLFVPFPVKMGGSYGLSFCPVYIK
ncbi:hypothetical protein VNO77_36243 [Canavalia gladiata]|uniref:Uncharacterized protein n=1 Tax=Canavalia gladiata TaxID=3824 RepID=A0AAN9KAA4_CANGL